MEATKGYPFYLPPMNLQPSWRYSTGPTSLGAGAVGWVSGRAWHKEGAEERLTELNGKSGWWRTVARTMSSSKFAQQEFRMMKDKFLWVEVGI